MATWTLYFRGGWGRENSAKPSPSKLEQRHEKFLRSSSRKLMLFGLVVVVAKEAIAIRVLIVREGRNQSDFGKHLGHREHERFDLVEWGSHPRRPRSYKAWTSAAPAFPMPHVGTSSFAFLGSATLAQNQALQARREKLLLRKTRALPGFRLIPCPRPEPERLPDHKAGQREPATNKRRSS